MDIGTAKVSACGPRARAAPRAGSGRSRRAVHGGRLPAARPRRAGPGSPRAAEWRMLVGGTGLYLRAVARGMPLDETGRDPEVRAELERRLAGEGGLHRARRRAAQRRAHRRGTTDLANPRRVVRALERVDGAAATRRRRSRVAIPRDRSGSACRSSRGRHRALDRRPCPRAVRSRPPRRGRRAARALRPGPARLLRLRLPRGVRRTSTAATLEEAIERDITRNTSSRAASGPGSAPSPTSTGWTRPQGRSMATPAELHSRAFSVGDALDVQLVHDLGHAGHVAVITAVMSSVSSMSSTTPRTTSFPPRGPDHQSSPRSAKWTSRPAALRGCDPRTRLSAR